MEESISRSEYRRGDSKDAGMAGRQSASRKKERKKVHCELAIEDAQQISGERIGSNAQRRHTPPPGAFVTTDHNPVLRGYRLSIPRVPLSPNRVLGKHWSAKAKEKKAWEKELWAAGSQFESWELIAQYKKRVTVTIYNIRRYDEDNAWASVKPILDAMKALRMIVDDAASYCDLTVKQERSLGKKDKRTVIEVEPA